VTRNTEMSLVPDRSRRTASGSPTRASAPLVIRGPRPCPCPPWPRSSAIQRVPARHAGYTTTSLPAAEFVAEGTRQAQPHPRMHGQMGDVVAGEVDGARCLASGCRELAHQRGLAGAIGARIRAWISPGRTSIETLSVAIRPPKRLIRPVAASSAQP